MLWQREQTVLLVVDIQGKLARLVADSEIMIQQTRKLIAVAQILQIPTIFTEQVPDKIGSTIDEIKSICKDFRPVIKTSFSCWIEPVFQKSLKALGRKQVVICGIEAHVCVFQTVADLLNQQYSVQVVADAVASRQAFHKEIALSRMRQLGAQISCTEMTATELLRIAQGDQFKKILQLIK